jgi:formylglycine-generating enzyme required for sulfatase activity
MAHEPPSCAGFQGTECQGGDCCESLLVPGGTVSNDGSDWAVPSFRLDKYEVTVARFRNFVNAAPAWQAAGNPVEGAGAHPSVPGSGWRTDWTLGAWLANGLVPTWYGYPTTWGSTPDSVLLDGVAVYLIPGSDLLAVNWVPFNIAFAFCIWDGGRLPGKVEWLRAAHGGDAQTTYAWGNSPTAAQMFATLPAPTVTTTYQDSTWKYHAIPVGSAPASAGLFGHQDLDDGLYEYLRDAVPSATSAPAPLGMIELAGDDDPLTAFSRTIAGPNWAAAIFGPLDAVSSYGVGDGDVGFRCARDP